MDYDVNREVYFEIDDNARRDHGKKLFKRRFRLDVGEYFFNNRIVKQWNLQSDNCVNSNTTNTFKKYMPLN